MSSRTPPLIICQKYNSQTEVESRTQGSRPRPRTQKKFESKAKDRPSRGQGPRTQTQVFSKKKMTPKIFFRRSQKKDLQKILLGKKGLQKVFFRRSLLEETKKKGLCRFSARFLAFSNEISTVQK